jgi:hypothetical protein
LMPNLRYLAINSIGWQLCKNLNLSSVLQRAFAISARRGLQRIYRLERPSRRGLNPVDWSLAKNH